MADWFDQTVWWQVYPLGFLGAEPAALPAGSAPVPRLRRLAPWLDYLVELGCNGLLLGPIFASETHGYDTTDHFAVDPRLGTADDLRWLCDACHERGVRVMLDGVFNHVGRGCAAFQDVLARRAASPFADWFRLDWQQTGPDGFGYADFEGHRQLVTLNHASAAVSEHVARVMEHWLALGADAWRLDAAYAVPPDFWRPVLARVRERFPEARFAGEVIHGDYAAIAAQGSLDSLTQYELWKAIWSSLNDRNWFELRWALQRHNQMSQTFAPLTFIGNHDVTRIASQLSDLRHLPHALAVLMTVAGSPSLYYGDEQAFRGIKEHRAGGDDAIRPAFPVTPAELAPDGWPTYRLHQRLIALRRSHPWLPRATTTITHITTHHLVYRVDGEGQHRSVALNLADQPVAMPLPAGAYKVAAGEGKLRPQRIELGAFGWAVLLPTD